MNEPLTVGSDALLLPFLQAHDHSIADSLLTDLIQKHADPIIAKIIKSKLRVSLDYSQGNQQNQDALEIAGELRATLIADLRAAQQQPIQKSIRSFPDYVAVKTYSACADYFREKNPQRWRLKNRLRYQLKQNPRFALWKAENNCWYAGLKEWAGTVGSDNQFPLAESIPDTFAKAHALAGEPSQLLSAIFERVGNPVEFERIVTLVAEVWNITDSAPQSLDDSDREPERASVSSTPGVNLLLEQRLYLEKLWAEVGQLPVLQRAAVLLNLRDAQGGSAIFFVPHLGIASQKEIGQALELSDQEFSALWTELPLDDSRIAQMFGLTRQQVINLRKTARERLARRMDKSERPATTDDSKKRY